jgi:hypothetical protein
MVNENGVKYPSGWIWANSCPLALVVCKVTSVMCHFIDSLHTFGLLVHQQIVAGPSFHMTCIRVLSISVLTLTDVCVLFMSGN